MDGLGRDGNKVDTPLSITGSAPMFFPTDVGLSGTGEADG